MCVVVTREAQVGLAACHLGVYWGFMVCDIQCNVVVDYLFLTGFDRHLLGLYLIAKEEGLPVPDLFTDPLYAKR